MAPEKPKLTISIVWVMALDMQGVQLQQELKEGVEGQVVFL